MPKRSVLSSLLLAAANLFSDDDRHTQKRKAARIRSPLSHEPSDRTRVGHFDRDEATRRYLIEAMLPLTVVPGILDWLWHRQTKIETTSGTKESLFHMAMMGQNCAQLLAALFLDMNAGGLALISALALAHEATAMWDVTTTVSEREYLILANNIPTA